MRGVQKRAVGGRHAVDGDNVFDPDRHAHQGAKIGAAGQQTVDRPRRRDGPFGVDMLIGLQAWVEGVDARQIGARRRFGGGLATAQGEREGGDTALVQGIGGKRSHRA